MHKHIKANGLKLHVAEIGNGPLVVLFCHGFPEIWYTWRHQMLAVAKAGYRAIAFDYRGYGLSDQPPHPEKTTFADFMSDVPALLEAMNISKVFVVGKDFGAAVANFLALLHKERVFGVVTIGVPFMPPGLPQHFKLSPKGAYYMRWKEPGRAEADFARFDAKTVVRKIYIMFSGSEIPTAKENQEIMDLVEASAPLPSWITEEDIETYGSSYEKSGFTTALQVPYRSYNETPETINLQNPKLEVSSLLIMGEKDYCFKLPGTEDYIRNGKVKAYVPNLEIKYIPEGSHFVQEQFPDQVNQLLLDFFSRHSRS